MDTSENLLNSIKLEEYIKQNSSINTNHYYNFEMRQNENKYVFSMMAHYTWDFYIGEGKTINEAIQNAKVVINCYDKDFSKVTKELENMKIIDMY